MRFNDDGTTPTDNSVTVKSTPVSRQPLERSWLTVWPIFFMVWVAVWALIGQVRSPTFGSTTPSHTSYLTANNTINSYQHQQGRHAKEASTCDKQQKGGIDRPEALFWAIQQVVVYRVYTLPHDILIRSPNNITGNPYNYKFRFTRKAI